MEYVTFKTKKRDWHGLVSVLNYGGIREIGTKLYSEIMETIKKEKTDGVILDNVAGTIGLNSKFIPFLFSEMTKNEKDLINNSLTI